MSRRRRGRRPPGFTPPGCRELYNVILPMRGAEKRRFFNELSDRLVVTTGVAMAVVGYGAGGVLRAPCRAGRGPVRSRPRRGQRAIPPRVTRSGGDRGSPGRPRGAARPPL